MNILKITSSIKRRKFWNEPSHERRSRLTASARALIPVPSPEREKGTRASREPRASALFKGRHASRSRSLLLRRFRSRSARQSSRPPRKRIVRSLVELLDRLRADRRKEVDQVAVRIAKQERTIAPRHRC